MSVVTPFEFDDLISFRVSPCQAERAHGRFGAGVDKPHRLYGRDRVDDHFREIHLDLGGRAVAGALLHGLSDRIEDLWMGVAEDQRSPRAYVIGVAMVIYIEQVGALCSGDKARRPANALERPHGAVDATR